jgi:cyclopropane-fatty-acyl-phospholipid synthase
MDARVRSRIPVSSHYRYPSRRTKGLLARVFATSIQRGRVGLQFEDEIVEIGSGEYICTIAPPTLSKFLAMFAKPDYRLPRYFTDGYWCCEPGKLYAFLELLTTQDRSPFLTWFQLFNNNPLRDKVVYRLFPLRVKKNIAKHYNTSPEFMKLILGDRLEYTCAFFDERHTTLAGAQEHKIDLIIQRLGLSSEQNVLDLGCGWGQLAEAVAAKSGAKVTGINLSPGQINYALKHRSAHRVEFLLADYEEFTPSLSFDCVYSIGMLEHVGRGLRAK